MRWHRRLVLGHPLFCSPLTTDEALLRLSWCWQTGFGTWLREVKHMHFPPAHNFWTGLLVHSSCPTLQWTEDALTVDRKGSLLMILPRGHSGQRHHGQLFTGELLALTLARPKQCEGLHLLCGDVFIILHLPVSTSRCGGCVCKKTGTWRLCGPKPDTCSLRKGDVLNQTSCSRPSHVEGHRQWELGTSNRDLTVQYFPAQRSLLSASQTNKWTWQICYIKNLYPKAPCLEGVKNERIWF